MAITTETFIDEIKEIGQYKIVQIRTVTVTKENGIEITRNFHRKTLTPNADISGETTEVQSKCNSVWTDDIKSSYETFKSQVNAQIGE